LQWIIANGKSHHRRQQQRATATTTTTTTTTAAAAATTTTASIYAGAATTIWNALFEICKTMRFRYSIFGGVLKSIEFLSLALFGFGRENKNR